MLKASLTLTPPHPTNLNQTLASLQQGTQDPTYQKTRHSNPTSDIGTHHWLTTRYKETGLLLHFSRAPHTDPLLAPITIRMWTTKTPTSQDNLTAFANLLPGWIGAHDNWETFKQSKPWQELPQQLKDTHTQHPGLRLPSTGLLLPHLLRAITEQGVTGIEAMKSTRTLIKQYGRPAPATGDPHQPAGLYIPPDPQTYATIPDWTYHQAGYDQARARTLKQVAHRAKSLETYAQTHSIAQLASTLKSIPGIGPWSIAETLQRYCGHPDAISVGDYHLAHHITYALEGKRGNDTRMLQLLAPYTGNRQRVITLIKASGITEPRRAPRYTPQDIRHI